MLNIPVRFEDLLTAIEQLSDEQKRKLFEQLKLDMQNTKQDAPEAAKRIPDLHPGGWISEDFDEPLPDEFWFGEDK
ncbi:MAG: DUF2281 domain-containing protein [Chloroflexi bacterium]|nr:DUF2281 domain-containing protein [Chloroflexota bacterium]